MKSLLFFASSLLLLASCASVPDVPVCVELSLSKGWCKHTISDKEYYVDDEHKLDGKTWWDIRPTMVQVPSSSWKAIKVFIISNCKNNEQCEEITSWDRTVNSIDSQLESKGN